MRTLIAVTAAAALALSGCGGLDSSGSSPPPSPTPSSSPDGPTPSNTHSALPGEPALVSVPGYVYTDPLPALVEEFAAEVPLEADVASIHGVQEVGGSVIGILRLYGMPEDLAARATGEYLMESWSFGGQPTLSSIAGTAVVTGSSNDKQVTMWIHDDVLSIFEGKPAADATAFTIAYLQAHA